MVGTLQPASLVCIAAIQHGIFDLARANMQLVEDALKYKPTLLIDHHVGTQDAIEGSINSDMQDTIRESKREFKKQFESQYPDFATSKTRKNQYKLEKIRHVLQVEQTLLCEDLKERFKRNVAVSFPLKIDSKTFTPRRWLEIFFDTERTPTEERDALKKYLLKERSDFFITHVYYSAGQMGGRSVIGRFAKEIFNCTEVVLKKLDLDAERTAGTITEAILQTRNPDRTILEVFLRSLLIDHYTNMQMFIDGGMLAQISKLLPQKPPIQGPRPTQNDEIGKLIQEIESKEPMLVRAKAEKASKVSVPADKAAMIDGFAALLVEDVRRISNTLANILAVSSYLKKSSATQSVPAAAPKGRERAASILRTSDSRLANRISGSGLTATLPAPAPLGEDKSDNYFRKTMSIFRKFLLLIAPAAPSEPESLLTSFTNLFRKIN